MKAHLLWHALSRAAVELPETPAADALAKMHARQRLAAPVDKKGDGLNG